MNAQPCRTPGRKTALCLSHETRLPSFNCSSFSSSYGVSSMSLFSDFFRTLARPLGQPTTHPPTRSQESLSSSALLVKRLNVTSSLARSQGLSSSFSFFLFPTKSCSDGSLPLSRDDLSESPSSTRPHSQDTHFAGLLWVFVSASIRVHPLITRYRFQWHALLATIFPRKRVRRQFQL